MTLGKKVKINNLGVEYLDKLKAKIDEHRKKSLNSMSFDEFRDICEAHGYKYCNFWLAYLNWDRKQQKTQQKTLNNKNMDVMKMWAKEMEEKEQLERNNYAKLK